MHKLSNSTGSFVTEILLGVVQAIRRRIYLIYNIQI